MDLSRTTEKSLWEKYEDGCAHFVVKNSQIIGCGVVWHETRENDREPIYAELGTVWTQQQDRVSILAELGDSIKPIAKGKKIMGFCKEIRLARYFRRSHVFPVTTIANWKTCPPEVLESFLQFRGWYSSDISMQSKYTRVLYLEDNGKITPWYLLYE
ncbi:MAG: hypothetical protein EBE86_032820 [Hormoscilla sp. GUM202]|nr:hypothetical protein [Hormoscilla sp. GUM202]